jgi:glycosyltransferase involved in cell wall biosynthesis
MKRLAYASPVNPAPSGISDYSEELLPYLGMYVDITLYVEDGLRPTNPHLARHIEIRPVSRLERDHRRRPFDAIVYHMGNSPAHIGIWRALQRTPGFVVLHDFVLHHFMLQEMVALRGQIDRYRAEMRRRYGVEGAHVAELMLRGRFPAAAFDFPFCEDVLERAMGVLAHSRYVLDRVAALKPGLPTVLVSMGIPLPPFIPRNEARARLGLPHDDLILASFGHINPYKRLEPALRALRDLRDIRPDARYLLVGSISPNYDARSVVERLGLTEAVTITGYVPRSAFEEYVAAADICLNLRHPTAGETSASLLRLLGAGRPTLVTATGAFTELPPGVAAQVDPDESESDLILAYCRLLAERPDIAAAMGAAARAYVARYHTLEGAARGYATFLAHQCGWGDVRPLRATPLWDVEARHVAEVRAGDPSAAHRFADHAPVQQPASAPTPPSPVQTVAGALAELGLIEDDRDVLATVARAMHETGMVP